MPARPFQAFCCAVLLLLQPRLAEGASTSLPVWVTKAIAERQAARSRDVIEESAYGGNRVFEIISGYRFDTGDEHVLFGEDGKEICKFGGFAGHVTSGSCDIAKVIYVRTLYQPKRQQPN